MKLAFKNRLFGWSEKEVPIILNIGTLEAVCKELDIELYQIGDSIKGENFDFMSELLYQGYVTACKERYRRPKYDRVKAILWNDHLSKAAASELAELMMNLFGKFSSPESKKKATKKQPGPKSEVLQ